MSIPDFLKRENVTDEGKKMYEAVQRYKEHFNEFIPTEICSYSEEEWIEIIDYCIQNNIRFWDYIGEEYDPGSDY